MTGVESGTVCEWHACAGCACSVLGVVILVARYRGVDIVTSRLRRPAGGVPVLLLVFKNSGIIPGTLEI